jgi:hypothetical protein
MTRAESLKEAARLLCGVIASLAEAPRVTCDHCGMVSYVNREAWQAGTSLQSIAAKLERMAGQKWAEEETLP